MANNKMFGSVNGSTLKNRSKKNQSASRQQNQKLSKKKPEHCVCCLFFSTDRHENYIYLGIGQDLLPACHMFQTQTSSK